MRISKELVGELSQLCAWGFQKWGLVLRVPTPLITFWRLFRGSLFPEIHVYVSVLHGYVLTLRLRGTVLVIGIESSIRKGRAHVTLRRSSHV